jgi:hypothetical protein
MGGATLLDDGAVHIFRKTLQGEHSAEPNLNKNPYDVFESNVVFHESLHAFGITHEMPFGNLNALQDGRQVEAVDNNLLGDQQDNSLERRQFDWILGVADPAEV